MQRKRFLFSLLFLIFSLFLLGGEKAPFTVEELPLEGYISQPSFSPNDANLIACFSLKNGETSLILLDLGRSKKQGRTLFSSQRAKLFPNLSFPIRWSPKGDSLLFLANSSQASPSLIPKGIICLVALPSGKLSTITESEDFFSPAFSPDGKLISTLRGTPNNSALWLYDREKNKWTLKLEGLKANSLAWSKDGRLIYVAGDEGIYEVKWADTKPNAKFFPFDKRIISLYPLAEGILLVSTLTNYAQLSPTLLPLTGADIETIELEENSVRKVAITKNGASFNPVLSPKGMLIFVRNTPLLDDDGLLKGVVSSIWNVPGQELLVPYCDGDSLPSLSPDEKLLAFTKEGKLCLLNIEKLKHASPLIEEGEKEISEKVNQLRQISLALLMYCQDYDENFPPIDNLSQALRPYVKNEQILSILSDPHFHYYSLPSLPEIAFPSQTLLARWEISPGLFLDLYADGVVKVVKNNVYSD
ncbi:MAG: eIF2A-related protein [bacterium]